MKERILRCGTGSDHPTATRIALITQCDSQITYHPPVRNWFSRQFDPAAETIHSIYGETVLRVAEPDHAARLAKGLKTASLSPPTIFTMRPARRVPNDQRMFSGSQRSSLQRAALKET